VVVVQAISALCQKYPRKHSVMMTFLSNMLRDDGGFEYKRAIVDCIISIVEENPESKEAGLAHLCEFIEDCEHTVLATKILHLLGKEGPRTPVPSKYIRFIFNRVVLENEAVRAEITLMATKPEKLAPSRQDIFQEQLAVIPEFMNLGPLFKSSEPVQLTEAETEYFVRCIKHMFTNHIVFQFDCTNTLNDQLLEKVTVQVEPSDSYEVLCCIPVPSLPYNQPGICYTLVRLPDDDSTAASLSCPGCWAPSPDLPPSSGPLDPFSSTTLSHQLETAHLTSLAQFLSLCCFAVTAYTAKELSYLSHFLGLCRFVTAYIAKELSYLSHVTFFSYHCEPSSWIRLSSLLSAPFLIHHLLLNQIQSSLSQKQCTESALHPPTHTHALWTLSCPGCRAPSPAVPHSCGPSEPAPLPHSVVGGSSPDLLILGPVSRSLLLCFSMAHTATLSATAHCVESSRSAHQPTLMSQAELASRAARPHDITPCNLSGFHPDPLSRTLLTQLSGRLRPLILRPFSFTAALSPSSHPLAPAPARPTPDTTALSLDLHRALGPAVRPPSPLGAVISLPDALLHCPLPSLFMPTAPPTPSVSLLPSCSRSPLSSLGGFSALTLPLLNVLITPSTGLACYLHTGFHLVLSSVPEGTCYTSTSASLLPDIIPFGLELHRALSPAVCPPSLLLPLQQSSLSQMHSSPYSSGVLSSGTTTLLPTLSTMDGES
ncbi:hypothetical protein EI555_010111, partial [Monodon monoceros]